MNAIKTTFKGVEYKSRFEADIAYSLDKIGWEFMYEPVSILLPNCGIHYIPDFYVPAIRLWIESRGYESEKGEAQIQSFAKYIKNEWVQFVHGGSYLDYENIVDKFDKDIKNKNTKNTKQDYLVIKPNNIMFYEGDYRFGNGGSETACIIKCEKCHCPSLIGESGWYGCRYCNWSDGNSHIKEIEYFTNAEEFKKAAIIVSDWSKQ
jgi:hypothetical protein